MKKPFSIDMNTSLNANVNINPCTNEDRLLSFVKIYKSETTGTSVV